MTEKTSFSHSRFMNYESLKKRVDSTGDITVRCFDKQFMIVCPDPFDKFCYQTHQTIYEMGGYISIEDIRITKETYHDPAVWN